MNHPTSVLLDLDGTLIDSRPGIVASHHAALRELGHAPDPGIDLTFVIGPVLADVIGLVLAPYGETRAAEAVAAYRRHYYATGILDVRLYDGVAELLPALKGAGLRVYLATAKRTAFAERILDHLDIARHFDGVYGSEPDGFRDHKPDLIADVLQRHAIAPDAAVMVGDRRHDIAGAHANGLRGVGVLWGYGTRAELEAAGADRLVATVAELTAELVPKPGTAPPPR